MNILPIQVIPEGVLIPLHYLNDAHEFELEVVDNHLLVRPKANGRPEAAQNEPVLEQDEAALLACYPWIGSAHSGQPTASAEPNAVKNWLSDLIGIAESKDPTASVRAEEILMAEIDRRDGWTLRPYLDETL